MLTLITDKLDALRCDSIYQLLDGCRDLVESLYRGEAGCTDSCTAMLLGTLLRGLKRSALLALVQDPAQRPFHGTRLDILQSEIMGIESPIWYTGVRLNGQHKCTLKERLEPLTILSRICAQVDPVKFGFGDH
jgi:hypothetical protein